MTLQLNYYSTLVNFASRCFKRVLASARFTLDKFAFLREHVHCSLLSKLSKGISVARLYHPNTSGTTRQYTRREKRTHKEKADLLGSTFAFSSILDKRGKHHRQSSGVLIHRLYSKFKTQPQNKLVHKALLFLDIHKSIGVKDVRS